MNQEEFFQFNPGEEDISTEYMKAIEIGFKKHFENLNFKQIEIDADPQSQIIKMTLQLEQFSMKFLVFCTTTIDCKQKRIDCKSYIAKPDGQILMVKEKYLQRLLCRYFCRLNSSLRFGCFYIQSDTGQLVLKLNPMLIHLNWSELFTIFNGKLTETSQQRFSDMIKSLHYTCHYAIGFHIYRLMHLINKLSSKVFPFLQEKIQNQFRKVFDEAEQRLRNIREIIQKHCTNAITAEQIKRYEAYFQLPKANNQLKIIQPIYLSESETRARLDQNQVVIGEGGFSRVFKSELSFSFNPTGLPIVRRTLASKIDKKTPDYQDRVTHEKRILEHLSQPIPDPTGDKAKFYKNFNGFCPYIGQFYSTQKEYDDVLFMEFYTHTSMDSFRVKFNNVQSLNTKLYILYQIAMGLRYLEAYGVYHNDLKPGNILISKQYLVKITDFGEAYCEKVQSIGGPGRTIPFVAPELFEQNGNAKPKPRSDIFSFGMLMYEYLFDHYPIDFKKSNSSHLRERYLSKSYQIRSNVDSIKRLGPKHLMKCLRNLSVKCLDADPNNRPTVDWIVICLREGLQYIEKMY